MECFQSGRWRIVFEWKGPFPDIGLCVCGGGIEPPTGTKFILRGVGCLPRVQLFPRGREGG